MKKINKILLSSAAIITATVLPLASVSCVILNAKQKEAYNKSKELRSLYNSKIKGHAADNVFQQAEKNLKSRDEFAKMSDLECNLYIKSVNLIIELLKKL